MNKKHLIAARDNGYVNAIYCKKCGLVFQTRILIAPIRLKEAVERYQFLSKTSTHPDDQCKYTDEEFDIKDILE